MVYGKTVLTTLMKNTCTKIFESDTMLAGIDSDIPWHISRFHPDYQFIDIEATPMDVMKKAYLLGKEAGLRFIYLGNIPGEITGTLCPKCQEPLIIRQGFLVKQNRLKKNVCPVCEEVIAGVFID